MGFDCAALRTAVAQHGQVARVVIAEVRGSSPREVGASMLVWQGGQSGTIGGGTLEYEAAKAALETGARISTHALGPDLGQCCGGAVTLVTEIYTAMSCADLSGDVIVRPVTSEASREMPLSVRRIIATARSQGQLPQPQLLEGWMLEPVFRASHPLWVWGAGHVGRALINVLSPLPEFDITWVDVAQPRFPDQIPDGVTSVPATQPERLVLRAPVTAQHLIVTFSHQLDLELCNRLLSHGFSFAGLIGSKTKWARFRARLATLGHAPEQIARITCPIGQKALGKHPQAIALGVAVELLNRQIAREIKKDMSA